MSHTVPEQAKMRLLISCFLFTLACAQSASLLPSTTPTPKASSATGTTTTGTTTTRTTVTTTGTSSIPFPSLNNVSPCVVNCLQVSVSQANCTDITDVTCNCNSAIFRSAAVNCISTQCPSELSGAESLAQQFCDIASVTLTFPPQTLSGAASITPTSIVAPTPTSAVTPAPTTSAPSSGKGVVVPLFSGMMICLLWGLALIL